MKEHYDINDLPSRLGQHVFAEQGRHRRSLCHPNPASSLLPASLVCEEQNMWASLCLTWSRRLHFSLTSSGANTCLSLARLLRKMTGWKHISTFIPGR